jgi:uncharacterized protein YkwD
MRSRTTCLVALLFGLLAAPSTASADCPGADLIPAADNLAEVRAAVLCLHNEERAERSLPALKEHARLRRAAAGHSADMVHRGYFSHTARGGVTFVDRILDAGYARRFDGWQLGENLAWGTGQLATARGVMAAWMDSPDHRRTVLRRAYRDVGIGIRLGIPRDDGVGATFTVDFGVREQ